MGNMSYCRFQNTLNDLEDCHDNMFNELSPEEQAAKNRLIRVCSEIAEEYGHEIGINVNIEGE